KNSTSIPFGRGYLDAVLKEKNGKSILSITGSYGIQTTKEAIEKELSERIKENKLDVADKATSNGMQKENAKGKVQAKAATTMDPVVHANLLIKNILLLGKLGVQMVTPAKLKPEEERLMKAELEKEKNPNLKLSDEEKKQVKNYLEGKTEGHSVSYKPVLDQGADQKQNGNKKGNTVSFEQRDIQNLKAYLGNAQTSDKALKPNPKYLDHYIVNLKEMMDANTRIPKGLISPELKSAVLKTLDKKSTFEVSSDFNITTSKKLEADKASSFTQSIGLPKSKSKSQSIQH
ncbi:MAG: hypothetical protein RJQ14_25715, partial [Marinoscillum sp.]